MQVPDHALFEKDILLDDVNPVDFFGVNNTNIELIRKAYPDVKLIARGNALKALGQAPKLEAIQRLITSILNEIRDYGGIDSTRVSELLEASPEQQRRLEEGALLKGPNGNFVKVRNEGQQRIIDAAAKDDVVFAVGPAGSGKTYIAVAMAVKALNEKRVKKIVLVRPAVEAGEHLGFLPGDLKEKIDPFLRPLYDALEDMIHYEKLKSYLERNIIEVVPLAYMRGRTLNNAYMILDEAQNATEMQLKMFLTRMGVDSKIIVTGDATQIDLPRNQRSGLIQCMRIFRDTHGISVVYLSDKDVVRHKIIRTILAAYDRDEQLQAQKERKSYPDNPHTA